MYLSEGNAESDVASTSFYRNTMQELGIPFTVDLIVCNPPWIPAKFVPETNPLDNGVYDQDEKFLMSEFNYTSIHLDKRGEMLLYSDHAYQLCL